MGHQRKSTSKMHQVIRQPRRKINQINDSERKPKNSSDDKRAECISDKEKALYAMYHTALINREKKLARQRRN